MGRLSLTLRVGGAESGGKALIDISGGDDPPCVLGWLSGGSDFDASISMGRNEQLGCKIYFG